MLHMATTTKQNPWLVHTWLSSETLRSYWKIKTNRYLARTNFLRMKRRLKKLRRRENWSGNAIAMQELFRDIDSELQEIKEAKDLLQEKQDELGYDMFNLGAADEWAKA